MLRAVEFSHLLLRAAIRPGDGAVDATAGNGRDLLFLTELTGPDGMVFGFDIQPCAIASARRLLESHRVSPDCWELFACSHAAAAEMIPHPWHGRLGAVIFNLGYLPGGDHSITTSPDSTLTALNSLLPLLRIGGLAVVVAYTGHPGGGAEADAVSGFAAGLSAREWQVMQCRALNAGPQAPRVIAIERTAMPVA